MKIAFIILLIILVGCNGETGSLSPISGITDGLYISPVSSKSSSPDTTLTIPFQIQSSSGPLSCIGSVSVSTSNNTLFPSGGFALSGSAPNCVLTVLPGTGLTGFGSITLRLREGTKSVSTSFPVTIALQLPPSVVDMTVSPNLQEDAESTITLPYTDVNGDLAISCNLYSVSALLSITTPCTCSAGVCQVGLTSRANTSGTGQFIFTVTDNDGESNTATANFTIDPVNDLPVITMTSQFYSVANQSITSIPFTITDIDSSVSCGSVTSASGNTLVLLNSMTISGTAPNCQLNFPSGHVQNASGPVTITLTAIDSHGGSGTGSLVLFLTGWGQTSFFKPDAAVGNTRFGYSVSIDGNTMAVGADRENTSSAASGAVFVYTRSGDTWSLQQKIKAPVIDQDDNFGHAVSLSKDFLAISAPRESSFSSTEISTSVSADDSRTDSGATYVYHRTGASWNLSAFIKAAYTDFSDRFGEAVSIHHDRLVVTVPYDDSSLTTISPSVFIDDSLKGDSGAAYVYKWNGSNWVREAFIKAMNSESSDYFGWSTSLSGTLLAVGAYTESSSQTTISYPGPDELSDDNGASVSGAVYIYKWNGFNWAQEAYIKAPNSEAFDYFGYSVSIDGDKLAVGAPFEDNDSTVIVNGGSITETGVAASKGAVYVFRRASSTDWQFESYIKGFNNFGGLGYGMSLALKGNTLVVGSPLDDYGHSKIINTATAPGALGTNDSGSAHVYHFDGTAWSHEAYINPRFRTAGDKFGHAVSISGDSIVVGSPQEDSGSTGIMAGTGEAGTDTFIDSGAAYVYRNYSRLFEVTEYWATSGGSSITINFQQTGGSAISYVYRYSLGTGDPGSCLIGVNEITGTSFQLTGLTPDTEYTFRICATNGSSTTEGRLFTVTTKSSGGESAATVDLP